MFRPSRPRRVPPGPGQESVWDYPRPPAVRPDSRCVRVETDGGILLAETRRAVRVLETASPPTFYIPPEDVRIERLRPARQSSWCEWKGRAGYWRPAEGGDGRPVAWSYPSPTRGFESLRDHVAFYPGRVVCTVDGERVRPQPGPFYGGWVTDEIVGPIKGEPGTEGW